MGTNVQRRERHGSAPSSRAAQDRLRRLTGTRHLIRNNNNQQNGRRRGRGGGGQGGGGGGGMPPRASGQNYGNNNRLDIRQRGNATQLLDKYKTLARDAAQQGDRVASEYYLQYADHYFRVLNEIRERQPEHQRGPRPGYDADEDGEDVGNGYNPGYAAATADAAPAEDRDDQAGSQRYDNSSNGNGQREERQPRQYDNRIQEGRAPEVRDQQGRDQDDRGQQDGRQDNRQQDGRQQDDRSQQRDGRQDNRNQQDGRGQQENRGQQDSRRDDGRETRRDRGESRADRNGNGNPRFENTPRTEGNARVENEPRAEVRDAPRREPRAPRAPREDYRDERPRVGEPARREAAPELALSDDEPMISGLPGPATLAPVPLQATVEIEDGAVGTEEAPKRRRGRPRKVVEETPVDA